MSIDFSPERNLALQANLPVTTGFAAGLGEAMMLQGDGAMLPPTPDAAVVLDIQKVPGLPEGFYNAAAWKADDNPTSPTMLLGRHVKARGAPGTPDVGPITLAVIVDGEVHSLTEVWAPEEPPRSGELPGDLIEDIRAKRAADGSLKLGLTRLSPKLKGKGYEPFPAFSTTTTEQLLGGEFPDTFHIIDLQNDPRGPAVIGDPSRLYLPSGKNATPLDEEYFMFRPEVADHEFLAFSLNQGGGAERQQRLALEPDAVPSWATRRIGSAMPPEWLNAHEGLLIIHGIRVVQKRSIYSIGSARLFRRDDGRLLIDNVSAAAHLTPESFPPLFPNEQVELRVEERQAVYICGGVALRRAGEHTPHSIETYPNVGDTRTVKATFSVDAITSQWDRSEPKFKN